MILCYLVVVFGSLLPTPITGQHMFYWDIAVFASLT